LYAAKHLRIVSRFLSHWGIFNGWSAQQGTPDDGSAPRITFEANQSLEFGRDARYVTVGKGWP
jgi:hypothetical protein